LFLFFSPFFIAKHLQCCTGGSRRTTTAPTDYASRCISESHFHSVGNIRLSSSWALIVYGKERCAYLSHLINSFPYRQLDYIGFFFSSTFPPLSVDYHWRFNRSVYSSVKNIETKPLIFIFVCVCIYLRHRVDMVNSIVTSMCSALFSPCNIFYVSLNGFVDKEASGFFLLLLLLFPFYPPFSPYYS
jgi:hypothetical protein